MTTSAMSVDTELGTGKFQVHLEEFDGPFDLLLGLIARHKLEVTELALSQVTDEFLSYIRAQGIDWSLDEASSFLVIAATLLDLKTARLLPSGEVEDEEDIALLEVRDILFARLLQYRAYKQVSGVFRDIMESTPKRYPRQAGLEPRLANLLPEVVIGLSPVAFATLAVKALLPKQIQEVGTEHLHAPLVSVKEQALFLIDQLKKHQNLTFQVLIQDCETIGHVVARFLALLELFKEQLVMFEQLEPMGPLHLRYIGTHDQELNLITEFDEVIKNEDANE